VEAGQDEKVNGGKVMASERTKWQAKDKALPVQKATIMTPSDAPPVAMKAIQMEKVHRREGLYRESGKRRREPRAMKTPS